jgi:hypothetical protein
MTNLVENSSWDAGVLQFATTDPIQGGPGGIDNQPHQSLTDRTLWLRNRIAAVITQAGLTEVTTDNQQLAEVVLMHCASTIVLRTLPVPVVPNSQTALMVTRGLATDGDGFGSAYKWVFNATVADNGSSVIAPTGVATGRWISSGLNATSLGGQPASFYASVAGVAAGFETLAGAAANLTAAENFASSVASVALSNSESFATSADAAVLANAENFATSADATVLSIAENFANTAATNAKNQAIASSESFASTAATNAQNSAISAAEAFANTVAANAQNNAENFSLGTALVGGHKSPAGFITQGGIAAGTASAPGALVSFSTPFQNNCFAVVATALGENATVTVLSFNLSSFRLINGVNGNCSWIAIGN